MPTAGPIREVIDLPVFLDNDANCAALAENMLGAARGANHSLTITIGTGLGCGIIINGKIYSGFNSDAGEAGHMASWWTVSCVPAAAGAAGGLCLHGPYHQAHRGGPVEFPQPLYRWWTGPEPYERPATSPLTRPKQR